MRKALIEIWNSLEVKEKAYLKLGLYLILILGFVSIIVLPWIFTREFWSFVDYKNTGAIGDTINGISGPFIALIAAILTFLAFYIQYKANIQQRSQFVESLEKQKEESLEQEKIWRSERFENRFYELLKLHKDNVDEMDIDDNLIGRKCFIHMFYELRYCYLVSKNFFDSVDTETKAKYEYSKINLMEFSYRLFFYGIGPHSEKHFIYNLKKGELNLFNGLKIFLKKIQENYTKMSKLFPDKSFHTEGLPDSGVPNQFTTEFYYLPFEGHANRLGHYYRHLFQTTTYIVSSKLLNEDEKYGYIKMLRAQLSNFEQLMLYYNSLAWFDLEWREAFTKYRLIKNLPLPLADFNTSPEEHFKDEIKELKAKGIEMFEWHE